MDETGTSVDYGPSVSDKTEGSNGSINETPPSLVVAIDVGTYACGVALQLRVDFQKTHTLDSIKVQTKWKTGSTGFISSKIPSCMLLRPDKTIAEFGYRADREYSKQESLPKEKRPADWNDWYYFRFFKMRLYCGEELSLETPVEAANDKHLPAVEVFAKTISFLKETAIEMLKEGGLSFQKDETKWVITVPAIWNDYAKHVMHEAAEQAGIASKNLSIALEPECAAIYMSRLPLDKMDVEKDDKKSLHIGVPRQIITVVDIGGGTVDITTVQINQDRTMSQVCVSCGGPWGGTKVNEKFEMYLKDMIGAETMATFVKENPLDYYDLRMDFERCKREMDNSDEMIPIRFPESLKQLWEQDKGKKVGDILRSRGDVQGVEFSSSRLFFPASIIRNFFQDTVDGTLKTLNDQVFSNANFKNVAVSSIILVGGCAESSFVVTSLREKLKVKNIPLIRPQSPETAVLIGAVLFGQNEMIISSRIMRHTYGIAMTMEFVKGKHRQEEQFLTGKTLMANNVFRKHVTIGQSVKTGDWISCKEYYPESESQTSTTLHVFTSDKPDPVHTTDPGCKYVGKVEIIFDRSASFQATKKAIRVEFKFGGTELKVRAVTTTGNRTHVKYFKLM